MGKIVGINLGTTNSLVAVLEGGEPVVMTTAEGRHQAAPSFFDPKWNTRAFEIVGDNQYLLGVIDRL